VSIGPSPNLERKLDTLPDQPGVYLWKDRQGRIIYVGKAKRLRQRVRSYFASDHAESPKLRMLMRVVADLDTIVVPSESEALLLENTLIKEHAPRFNIQLRDDKSYPSIAVTLAEPFPRVLVVRRVTLPGARHFGPYTDVGNLRRTLRIIRRMPRLPHRAMPRAVRGAADPSRVPGDDRRRAGVPRGPHGRGAASPAGPDGGGVGRPRLRAGGGAA
jgi:excinuclease ABC subunit C